MIMASSMGRELPSLAATRPPTRDWPRCAAITTSSEATGGVAT